MNDISRYNYEELKEAALTCPNAENLEALASWFDSFGLQFWNGEEWEIDDAHSLRPVYQMTGEDESEIVGYELI